MAGMSMGMGRLGSDTCILQKFRWMITIDGIVGLEEEDGYVLPPSKAARPSLSFKEIEAQHLSETIYFPGKPDWKPLQVTVYNIKNSQNPNPVFDWVQQVYNVNGGKEGEYNYPINPTKQIDNFIMNKISLKMVNGCGEVMERWVYEDCWPQSVDHGDLDMSDSQIVTIDLTIRYARAYIY